MSKFAHNDHLKQGVGGAKSTKSSGSHTDPTGPTGAFKSKSSGSHTEQGEGGAKPRAANSGGSHTTPHPAKTDKTATRGGGNRFGNDRTNPTLGKSNAGSHTEVSPELKGKGKGVSHNYLGA